MNIKFNSNSTFNAGYTMLHSHNVIFDLYRSEQLLKFFTDEMLNKAKTMLAFIKLTEGEDYVCQPYNQF